MKRRNRSLLPLVPLAFLVLAVALLVSLPLASTARADLPVSSGEWMAAGNEPPTIDKVGESYDPINRQGCPAPNSSDITAHVVDASGVAEVRLYYTPPGGSETYVAMIRWAGDTYDGKWQIGIGPFSQAGILTYFIWAQDSEGLDGKSEEFTLTINSCCLTPSAPTLVSPANDAKTSNSTPTFDWNPVSEATEYEIQVDESSTFASPLVVDANTVSTNYTPASALADGTWYWRVKAHNAGEGCNVWGAWSAVWHVTVDTLYPSLSNVRTSREAINRLYCSGPTEVTFRVDASDSSGIASVSITFFWYDGGSWDREEREMAPESGNTYFCKTGLELAGTWDYQIWAEDGAGNLANLHGSFPVDNCIGPDITNSHTSTGSVYRRGCPPPTGLTISADVSDFSGVDHVVLEYTPPGSTLKTANMGLSSGSTYQVVIGSFEQAGTLTYKIRAYDKADNSSQSQLYSKTVLDCDSTAPDIKNIRNLLHPSQGTISVLADVTDASALEWLRLYYQPPTALAASSAYTFVTMTLQSGITYGATVGPFSSPGTLSYYVQARDVRGNQAQSSTTPLTVITDYDQVWLPIIMR